MGCQQSDSWGPSESNERPQILSNKSVGEVAKELLIQAIQQDNIQECAVIMQSEGIQPNTQLSSQGLFWMSIHFCCRWQAPKCLQYILKEFYTLSPRSYIEFINSYTSDGYTCIHLCAIWGSNKCFTLLNRYGGIDILVKDKMNKDAYQTAIDFKRDQISKVLGQFKTINIGFTHVQHQQLISGSIFDLSTKDAKKYQISTNNQITGLLANLLSYTEQEDRIRQKKLQIERDNERITNQKQQKEQQLRQKTITLLISQNLAEITKINQQYQKTDAQMQKEINRHNQEIKNLNNSIKDIRKRRVQDRVKQENQMTDEFANNNQTLFNQRLEDHKSIIKSKGIELGAVLAHKKDQITHPSTETTIQEQKIRRANLKQAQGGEIPVEFQSLYENSKKRGLFSDEQFPARNSSIGSESSKKKKKFSQLTNNLAWYRPTQFFKDDYQLFDGIDPSDIKQGSLGVCYYLATVSVMAKNPDTIKNIFVFYDKGLGFYLLKLYRNGVPTFIVIDDQIPCHKSLKTPLFTKPIGKEIWVLLLQKAWAKCIGSYLDAEAMTPDHMMEDLVGSPSYGEWMMKSPHEKLKQINTHDDQDHIIVLTSVPDKKIEGIANNHAYSMLKSYLHQGTRIYKIRNPWGRFQWNGKYGDKQLIWTEDLKKIVGFKQEDDGIFFLSKDQLLQAFCYFSISMIRPTFKYSHYEFQTRKTQQRQDLYFTFQLNNDAQLNLRVTQLFKRMVKDQTYQYSPLIFETGKVQANGQVTFIDEGNQRCYWGAKSCHSSDKVILKYKPGKYFVRIQMLWRNPTRYHKAVLVSYSSELIKFNRISQLDGKEYWRKLLIGYCKGKATTLSGKIKYSMNWMKGQLVLFATTQEPQITAQFEFDHNKMSNAALGFNAISNKIIQITLQRDNPNIGTVTKIDISQATSTGGVQIRTI